MRQPSAMARRSAVLHRRAVSNAQPGHQGVQVSTARNRKVRLDCQTFQARTVLEACQARPANQAPLVRRWLIASVCPGGQDVQEIRESQVSPYLTLGVFPSLPSIPKGNWPTQIGPRRAGGGPSRGRGPGSLKVPLTRRLQGERNMSETPSPGGRAVNVTGRRVEAGRSEERINVRKRMARETNMSAKGRLLWS